MRRISTLYLGGPDAAFPEAEDLIARKRALCEAAGFQPVAAFDPLLVETQPSEAMAREIYADRAARMRAADAAVINLTPWRGPHCDPGAAFEAGFFAALGKPLFAYMNVPDEADAELRARVEAEIGAAPEASGVWRDADGLLVEDFGLPEHLMLWAESRRLIVVVTPDVLGELTGFQMCLEAVRLYAD